MCIITTEILDEHFDHYQRCSCGKHLWNTRTNKLIKNKNGFFYVHNKTEHAKVPLHYDKPTKQSGNIIANMCAYIVVFILMSISLMLLKEYSTW